MVEAVAKASNAARSLIKGEISAALREMLLDGRLEEPLKIQMKPNFDTACWSWQSGSHRIFVGEGVVAKARSGLGEDDVKRYVRAYMHHERAHAMFTERDRAKMTGWLRELGVPFGLMNLVEDARVEARYRSSSDEGFVFGWSELEDLSGVVGSPAASDGEWFRVAFFRLIQAEGAGVDWGCMVCIPQAVCTDAECLYGEAVAASGTREAIVVAAEILRRYPELAAMTGRCGLELGFSMSGEAGKDALSEFASDAQDPGAPDVEPAKVGGHGGVEGAGGGAGFDGEDLLCDVASIEVDASRASALAKKLQALQGSIRSARYYAVSPGKQVSVRHAMLGRARWKEKRDVAGRSLNKTVLLVVDVSGSMDGYPLESAAHLIAGLSECAKAGIVSGEVILSTDSDEGDSLWMRKPLPWTISETERLMTHNAEGLCGTLERHDKLLVAADETYVFTDAHIGGRAVRHGEYRRRGMRVTGLYCNEDRGEAEAAHDMMKQHFQRFIVRSSIESLVEAIVVE